MSESQVFKILDLAYKSKITFLDTAASYGNSEERIGEYLRSNKDKKFRIITKFDLKKNNTLNQSLEKSLHNLKVDYVDTIMFHNYQDFESLKVEEINTLLELKGVKYKKLGISLYTNDQVQEILKKDIFEVVQLPFNVLDNEFQRGNYLKELKNKNIEVHTRSVYLQGLFFMQKERIPQKLWGLNKYLDKYDSIARFYGVDKSSLALHYALSKRYIDYVLVGVDSVDQLRINIKYLNTIVPKEALKALDEICVSEIILLNPSTWNQ